MSDWGDEYESGLELCLRGHMNLSAVNPNHELLKFGDVQKGDPTFYINQEYKEEFGKRFGKDGKWPVGVPACARALGNYYIALNNALKETENLQKTG